ncbi:MAG: DNA-formamidopyrimidine glycosylase family protein [Actinomycetota bacterium]
MPEGHTIHRLAGNLEELIGPSLSVSSPQGKFPGARTFNRKRLRGTAALGKHLLLYFDPGIIHIHLGLAGKFVRIQPLRPPALQVRMRLSTAEVAWDLLAPNICEVWGEDDVEKLRSRLGPDPLDPEADPERVWQVLERFSGPIGAALLDQSVIAGVGNVYRAEVLLEAGVHPARPAFEVSREEFDVLWASLRTRMAKGMEDGRIITVDTPEGFDRSSLPEAEARYLYKQPNCRRCGAPVEVSTVGGRTAYACPREQS